MSWQDVWLRGQGCGGRHGECLPCICRIWSPAALQQSDRGCSGGHKQNTNTQGLKKLYLGQMSATVLLEWTNDPISESPVEKCATHTHTHTISWQESCLKDRCSIQHVSIHSIPEQISILFISFPDQNRLAWISTPSDSDDNHCLAAVVRDFEGFANALKKKFVS